MADRIKVFISYSHKDESWQERLVTHLQVLEFQFRERLHFWVDTRISAGENWQNSINEALSDSKVAILLVTAHFLTSEFILNNEVPHLLENHAKSGMRIIPVIGKPCAWKVVPWLASMKVRPKDGRPISNGDDNQIETDLSLITYEVAALIDLIDDKIMGEQLASVNWGYTDTQRRNTGLQWSSSQEYVERRLAAAAIDTACIEITSVAQRLQARNKTVTPEFIYQLIELAISRGAPIYDSGSRIGCAQIYSHAVAVILDLMSHQPIIEQTNEARTVEAAKQTLEHLHLQSTSITPDNADDLAWKIRHTFDGILRH